MNNFKKILEGESAKTIFLKPKFKRVSIGRLVYVLPTISKGKFFGLIPGIDSERNAPKVARRNDDLDVYYGIIESWSTFYNCLWWDSHAFNVDRDTGKVMEMTNWFSGGRQRGRVKFKDVRTVYRGVRVPKKDWINLIYLKKFKRLSYIKKLKQEMETEKIF